MEGVEGFVIWGGKGYLVTVTRNQEELLLLRATLRLRYGKSKAFAAPALRPHDEIEKPFGTFFMADLQRL